MAENEYPKVMQSKSGSVVVANEEQEIALPSDFGGKAAGKSYAEVAAAEKQKNMTPEELKTAAAEQKAQDKADAKDARDASMEAAKRK